MDEPRAPRARNESLVSALWISLAYVLVASVWIVSTDLLVDRYARSRLEEGRIEVAKGLLFVACTGLMLYALIRRALRSRETVVRKLGETQERYELAIRGTNDGIWDWDIAGDTMYWSARLEELLGFAEGEMNRENLRWAERLHPDDHDRTIKALRAHLDGKASYDVEYRLRLKNGTHRWFRSRGRATRDAEGRAVRMAGSLADINERVETTERLRQRQRELERAEAVGRIGSWTSDPARDGSLEWSAEVYRIFGVAPGRFDGRVETFFSLVHPEDREAVAAASREALAGNHDYSVDHRIVRSDGEVRWVHEQAEIERDAAGVPVRMIGVVQDITARKAAEESLRTSEAAHRALLAAIPDAMFRMDRRGRYLDYHAPEPMRLLAQPQEFLGKTVSEVLPPELARPCVKALAALFATGKPQSYEYQVRREPGGEALYEVRMVKAGAAADEALLLVRNVTEQRDAERRMRESEQRLSLLVHSTPLGVVSWNPDFTVGSWNPGAERIFGYGAAEAIGRHATFMVPETARVQVETVWRDLLGKRGGFRSTNQNVRKDGSLIWCEWYNSPLVDPGGRVIGVASVVEDVTDRRMAQERQDFMMAELDHRVKNNLAAMISLAEQTARSAQDVRAFTDKFLGRLRAMARMHSVLARSRWQGADLLTLVEQTLEAFGPGSAGRANIAGGSVLLGPRAAQAMAIALNELATNAVKYGALSSAGGVVDVRWQVVTGPEGSRLDFRWAERGGPPVQPPARRGFGTELIEGAIAYEMRGHVNLEFPPEGVVCDIATPLGPEEPGPEAPAGTPEILTPLPTLAVSHRDGGASGPAGH